MSDDDTLAPEAPAPADEAQTIVDTVLDLDEALSGDVRRAERVGRFSIHPHLHARIDELEAELADLVDDRGRPLDRDPGMAGRDAAMVMSDLQAAIDAYARSFKNVRVTAMEPDAWEVFRVDHRQELSDNELSPAMCRELVVACAIAPKISGEQYDQLLDRYGAGALGGVAMKAFEASNSTGVDVPKSLLYSLVRRQQVLSQS